MKNNHLTILIFATGQIILGCGGTNNTSGGGDSAGKQASIDDDIEVGPVEKDGEILGVLALPKPLVKDGDEADPLPEGRDGLLGKAREELQQGHTDEALAIIDVLLVLHADDAEILQLRGVTLLKQGHMEDAMVDLKRCCEKGREDCCRYCAER
jgi:hypothetical protein